MLLLKQGYGIKSSADNSSRIKVIPLAYLKLVSPGVYLKVKILFTSDISITFHLYIRVPWSVSLNHFKM